jgi:hypothetical protein
VRLAQKFALENEHIRADAIEASEFPELSTHYRVYAVPRTVINGTASIEGSLPEGFFLDRILEAVSDSAEPSA